MAAPAVTHLNDYANIFSLNETFMTSINERAEKCGYFKFMEEALTFPPKGKFMAPNESAPGCDVWDDIVTAEIYVNPCFNIYHLIDVSLSFDALSEPPPKITAHITHSSTAPSSGTNSVSRLSAE